MSLDAQLESRPAFGATGAGRRTAVRGLPRARVAIACAFAAAMVPYVVAVTGPLRLGVDSMTYLGIADHLSLPPGHQAYPPVYPALLRLTEHVGLGSAWGFAAVQLALLLVGLVCVYLLCRRPLGLDPLRASLVCLAVLLGREFLTLTPTVMSDVPYFAVAMLALLALSRAEEQSGPSRLGLLALGCGLTALAIGVRIQGVALLGAVLVVVAGPSRIAAALRWARRRPALAAVVGGGALLVIAGIGVLVVRSTGYAHDVGLVWRDIHSTGQLISRVADEVNAKVVSFGDLAIQSNPWGPAPGAVAYLSAVAMVAVLAVGWMARRRLGAIEAFVVGTAVVVVAYAGAVPRFWMAAFPFLLAYAFIAAEQLSHLIVARLAVRVWVLGYVAAFIALAGHSIVLSTSGRRFPDRWEPQPTVAATYRVAFGEGRPGDRTRLRAAGVDELRRYEPLARPSLR